MNLKPRYNPFFLALWALLVGFTACSNEELNLSGGKNDGTLTLNYRIDDGVEGQTYALSSEPSECRVDEVYTLFFRASTHGTAPNQYVGYARTQISSSSSSGTAQVTLPVEEDVDAEWQLIFLANFDRTAFLDGETNVEHLLDTKVKGLTFDKAKKYLTAYFDGASGLSAPFSMSFSMKKEKTVDIANVIFRRRVSRIDVSNTASNFVIESVQVWNARTKGYLFDEGGSFAGGSSNNDFTNYTTQTVTVKAEGKVVQAQLYAFPNAVSTPTLQDHVTTCLMIGGKYNGSSVTTYYRVNVSPVDGVQSLLANSAYTLKITSVLAPGEESLEDAYDAALSMKVQYTLDKWDDTFLGTYVFDAYGNGLAISQRQVIFSEKGGQEVQLEVFPIRSSTHPLSGDWNIGSLLGTDAASFSVEKGTTESTKNYVVIKTLSENTGSSDRQAALTINWGDISIPVNLSQLNLLSVKDGIRVSSDDSWFPLAGGTKEVRVSLQGNFSGISRANITTNILYAGAELGWLTLLPGSTPDDPAKGIYYYNVSASRGSGVRSGSILFAVKQGSSIAMALARVTQTVYDGGVYTPQATLYIYRNKKLLGPLADQYTLFKGLPSGHSGANHLHFPMIERDSLTYQLVIQSPVAWRIVAPGSAGTGLKFSKTSDSGDPNNPKTVDIMAIKDVSVGWSGSFYVQYENGDKTFYAVHQEGVFARLPADVLVSGVSDPAIYFYGIMWMNGKMWLDRNLGATVGQNKLSGYYSNQNLVSSTGVDNDTNAKGLYFLRAQANVACPPGFRLPYKAASYGEWDWVYSQNKRSTGSGVTLYGTSCKNVRYVVLSTVPEEYWLLPVCGNKPAPDTGMYGNYWCVETGYYSFYSNSDTQSWFTYDHGTGISARCVRGVVGKS